MTIPEDAERMVDVAVTKYGRLDAAFNNAGISCVNQIHLLYIDVRSFFVFEAGMSYSCMNAALTGGS